MGKYNLLDIFKRNKELSELAYTYDFAEIENDMQKVYLKRMALDTCANFIAKAVSQSEFKTKNKHWYYKLNIRPNTDDSATQFWEKFIYKLVVDNQALIILSDADDLLIADSWYRNELAVYEDIFSDVVVKDYTFKRTFKMSEVLYLEYNNQRLERFIKGLFEDYGELHSRMIDAAKRNNQIRGTVSIDGSTDLKKMEDLQKYIDKLFNAFQKKSIALAPLIKGFDYKEYSNTTGSSNITMEEITKIPSELINAVADALCIPTALLHGNRAELKDNMTAFNRYCLAPLLQKIEDELNAKTIEPQDYSEETKIEAAGINKPDIFELAEPIDKLVSSSAFNPNEIRKQLGYEPREGGDEYVRTKNYESADTAKGGEKSEDNKY